MGTDPVRRAAALGALSLALCVPAHLPAHAAPTAPPVPLGGTAAEAAGCRPRRPPCGGRGGGRGQWRP